MILDNLKQVLQEFGAKVVYEAKFNAGRSAGKKEQFDAKKKGAGNKGKKKGGKYFMM